jgi:hypothetical protein
VCCPDDGMMHNGGWSSSSVVQPLRSNARDDRFPNYCHWDRGRQRCVCRRGERVRAIDRHRQDRATCSKALPPPPWLAAHLHADSNGGGASKPVGSGDATSGCSLLSRVFFAAIERPKPTHTHTNAQPGGPRGGGGGGDKEEAPPAGARACLLTNMKVGACVGRYPCMHRSSDFEE